MATIGNGNLTLLDLAKRTDPNGSGSRIIEALSKVNPILQDMVWQEGNLPTGHRFTSRTALPTPTWRRFNEGVLPSKSTTEQYDETCGMLSMLSKVDCKLAKLNGNEAAYRASEDMAFVQGLNIEANRALVYESVVSNPARIQGLAPRLNATSGNPAAAQIIKADSTASGADQTSIYLIGWGDHTVCGITPKGNPTGLTSMDRGPQLTRDANNAEFFAYVTEWAWEFGLAVIDSRYLVRVCNIDTGNLKADLSAGADLVMSMEDALTAIYEFQTVKPVFYMNRLVFGMLQKQLLKKGTVNALEYIDSGHGRVAHYRGIPIKYADAITSTESVVS
jgi:hypothetical protein